MKKRFLLLFCALTVGSVFADSPAPAQDSPLSLTLTPQFLIPLGTDATFFSWGGGATFSGQYRVPSFRWLFFGADLGYSYLPIQAVTAISLLQVGFSAGLRLDMLSSLGLKIFGNAGYSYGLVTSGSGSAGTPLMSAGAELSWAFYPDLSLNIGVKYCYYFDLLHDLAGSMGISYNLPAAGSRPVQPAKQETTTGVVIESVSLENIFPVLHTYYDSNPIGTLVLKNTSDGPISAVSVSLIVRQFMDAPKVCASVGDLNAGEERSVNLFALFKNNVFEIKESTKVPAEISVTYTLNDKLQTLTQVETLRIYDRNALNWDDTNKAAAFVMPKEPAVLMLSNKINSFVKPKMKRAIDANLQIAMGIHDALRLIGIAYVSPPLTTYAVASQNKTALDSVKFPLETIQYGSGDCSDLSVLYCSLLESMQVETAFITIPGHIFMAFALTASEEEVRKTFTHTDEFIFQAGKVWVPVETTEREGLFLTAWETGAKEWRENQTTKQANFYPVRAAWDTYEPVNYPGIGSKPTVPDQAQVVRDFQADVTQLVKREIYDRETDLQAAISKSENSARSLNSLGVLYARYDLSDLAEAQFQAALKVSEYVPALENLGNLRLRDKRNDEALSFYQRAANAAPHDPIALLGMARANHELQNYGMVNKQYDELKTLNPALAKQFAYLRLQGEEAKRSAEANHALDVMVWGEEE